MSKLSEFKNNKIDEKENTQNNKTQKENITEKDLMDKYNQYKDLDSNQIRDELFNEVARQKANGVFDYNKLENSLDSIKGVIGEDNYQNMKKILESLKWLKKKLIEIY